MLRRLFLALLVPFLIVATTAWYRTGTRSLPAGQVVMIRTVELSATSFKFMPSEVTVRPGDTVRFVQASAVPHNVEFTKTPLGSKLGAAKVGPFLERSNQEYDLVIDKRFPLGQYKFICSPHVTLGMQGTITVVSPQ